MTRDPASTQAKNEDALILLRGEVVLTHRYRKWLAELLEENTRALDGIEAAARRAAYETDRRSALHRGRHDLPRPPHHRRVPPFHAGFPRGFWAGAVAMTRRTRLRFARIRRQIVSAIFGRFTL